MATFSIPADFQLSTVDQLSEQNKKWDYPVGEVYGSLVPSLFGSGRSSSLLNRIGYHELSKYVESCKSKGIEFNYTLNFSCDSNLEFTRAGKNKVIKYLKKLDSLGVHRFTTVLPSMMDLISTHLPESKLSVSVIADVDSPTRLREFISAKSVDKIMLPEFMNRKVAQLERLISTGKSLGIKFGTIVNSTCLIDCPFRNFHYIFGSHNTAGKVTEPIDYWCTRCNLLKLNNPVEVLKMGWIRPEDFQFYVNLGIDVFKIAGREKRKADFVRVVDGYNKGSFDGNLWAFLKCFSDALNPADEMFIMENANLGQFTKRFFEAKAFCTTKNCDACNYCQSNASLVQVVNYDKWTSLLQAEISTFKNETNVSLSQRMKSLLR
jgi:collagenase-like PrtC family protease